MSYEDLYMKQQNTPANRRTNRRIAVCMFLGLLAVVTLLFGLAEVQRIFAASYGVTTSVYVPCTNYNYETSPNCKAPVDWFLSDEAGGYYGQLTSGVQFTQRPVTGDLHRFQLEEAFWFIDHNGVFMADSTLQAMSIALARGSM